MKFTKSILAGVLSLAFCLPATANESSQVNNSPEDIEAFCLIMAIGNMQIANLHQTGVPKSEAKTQVDDMVKSIKEDADDEFVDVWAMAWRAFIEQEYQEKRYATEQEQQDYVSRLGDVSFEACTSVLQES